MTAQLLPEAAQLLPNADIPAEFYDSWRVTFAMSETGFHYDTMSQEVIAVFPPLSDFVTGDVIPMTIYLRDLLDPAEFGEEWQVIEEEITVPEFHDEMAPEFCGFPLDELTDLQYAGREMVNELDTRHYTAVRNGELWEIWITSEGRAAKFIANMWGLGIVFTVVSWNEPVTITAPVLTPTPE